MNQRIKFFGANVDAITTHKNVLLISGYSGLSSKGNIKT